MNLLSLRVTAASSKFFKAASKSPSRKLETPHWKYLEGAHLSTVWWCRSEIMGWLWLCPDETGRPQRTRNVSRSILALLGHARLGNGGGKGDGDEG